MVFYHDFPKAYKLIGLVVLLVNCLERPVDPARCCPGLGVPVRDQNVQGFLYEGSDFVISLGEGLESSDQCEVES